MVENPADAPLWRPRTAYALWPLRSWPRSPILKGVYESGPNPEPVDGRPVSATEPHGHETSAQLRRLVRLVGVLAHIGVVALMVPLIFILSGPALGGQPEVGLLLVVFLAGAFVVGGGTTLWLLRGRTGRLVLACLDAAILIGGILIRTSNPGPWYDLALGLIGLGFAAVVTDSLLDQGASPITAA